MRIILLFTSFLCYLAQSQQPAILDRLVTIDTNTIWTQKDGYESSDFKVDGIDYFKKIDTSFFIKYRNKGYYLSKDGSGYKIVDMPIIDKYKPAAWDVPYDDINKIFGFEFDDENNKGNYRITSKKEGKIDSIGIHVYDPGRNPSIHTGGESNIYLLAYKEGNIILYADYFYVNEAYRNKRNSCFIYNSLLDTTKSLSEIILPYAYINNSLNYIFSYNPNKIEEYYNNFDNTDTYNVYNLGDQSEPNGVLRYGVPNMQLSQNSGFLINDSLAIALTYDTLRVYNFLTSVPIKSFHVADKKFFGGYYYDEASRSVIFNYVGITDNKSYNSVLHIPSLNIIRDTLNDKPYLGRILTRLDDGKYLSYGSGGFLYKFELDLGLDYADADFKAELIDKNTFKLTDNSKGPIVKWSWDLGDGNKSNERNLEHKYIKSGSYTVTLAIENEFGTKDTIVTQVNAKDALSSFYLADILVGTAPLTVSFMNRSFGEATKFIWNFGDGKSSMEENPVHIYKSPGTYGVSLTIFDKDGKFDIKLLDDLIVVR